MNDLSDSASPPPPAEAPPDFLHAPHYCSQNGFISTGASTTRKSICTSSSGPLRFAFIALILLAPASLFRFTPLTVIQQSVGFLIISILVALCLIPAFRRIRRKVVAAAKLLPTRTDSRYRVRVAGRADYVVAVRNALQVPPDSFEPQIIRVSRVPRPGGREVAIYALLFVLPGAAIWYVLDTAHISASMISSAIIYLAMAGAAGAWTFVWPTYLRIVPGRLDLLEYGLLGRGKPSIQSFNLRTASVVFSFPGILLITPTGSNQTFAADIQTNPWNASPSLGITVISAAITTADAPPLPDDELIG